MSLQVMASVPEPDLLRLPWQLPLLEWPDEVLAALPRGISRHIVRFARVGGGVVAIKEISEDLARKEYTLLRTLGRLHVPCVEPVAVISGRQDEHGHPLEPVLVTQHLKFSLPYRALFSQTLRPDTWERAVDALAVLLVRLHLTGLWWGDVSLSNTLFRRNAGEFAAYLVDVETGVLRDALSRGQREHDLEIASMNIAGEMLDLQAGHLLSEDVDAALASQIIVDRYHRLWDALTAPESFDSEEMWRVQARIATLNSLGFDVGELEITTDLDGTSMQIQPKVVDAGHHSRRLMRLTGLDVEENQARRMLNDLDAFRAYTDQQNEEEEIVAHQWLTDVYEPVLRSIPRELTSKLDPAEVFHEVLEHRWYLSERQGYDVQMREAVDSYIGTVLAHKPDEVRVVGVDTAELPIVARGTPRR
ncbi:MAG: DUF4032 domain-containing protein [Actinomycetales bacterium]